MTAQGEHVHACQEMKQKLRQQARMVPGLGWKLVVQYKKEQQQEHQEQGCIPQEPIQLFRMNSPPNMDKEVLLRLQKP